MIPAFEPDTGNLPPGVWEATWPEFEARFRYTEHRRVLLAGLRAALDALLHFFQRDRKGRPKGIVALDLGALP